MHSGFSKDSLPTIALLLIGVVASIVLLILPVMVGGMADQFGWGHREVGWLASADMSGNAVATLFVLKLITRLNWKLTILVSIGFAVIANVLSIYAYGFLSLMAIRVMTGIANGFILSITFVGLCHSTNPDRYFGGYVFGQLSLQVILLMALPAVIANWGMAALYLMLATASGASALLVQLIPDRSMQSTAVTGIEDSESDTPKSRPRLSRWAIVGLSAQAVYFLAPGAIWGYFESIGEGFSLSMAQVGKALGIASIAGIAGALIVIIIGVRFDRMLLMAAGVVVSTAAVVLLIDGTGFAWYLLGALLFSFAWNYTFPYQMGVLSLFDQTGSVAILSLLVQVMGLALGPALASFLVFDGGFNFILWTCVACYMVSYAMFFLANRSAVSAS